MRKFLFALLALTASLAWPQGQLASGHYVNQKFEMVAVYPRPDSETGTFANTTARHRWAWYDGSHDIQYEVAVKVYGGSPPHNCALTASPAGATVGTNWTAADHCVVKWIPQASFSTGSPATFTVQVTDQDGGTPLDITWTVATSSSTNQFVFLDDTGSDSADCSYATPCQTLSKMFGATSATSTYPKRIVYLRAGSYSTSTHSDAWNGGNGGESVKCRAELKHANHPMAYVAYPGEAVSISFSNSEITIGGNTSNNTGNDFLFSGSSTAQLTITGSADNCAETHNFWASAKQQRGGFQWVTFDGFLPRTAGGYTNSVPIFLSGSDTGQGRQYWFTHGVREINRDTTDPAHNDGLLWVLFGVDYFVADYGYARSTATRAGVSYKDTVYHSSTRYMDIEQPLGDDNEFSLSFIGQVDQRYNEVAFSRLVGPLWLHQNSAVLTQDVYSYRNTVYTTDANYTPGIRAWPGAGSFYSENDCVISNSSPHIANGGSGMSDIVDTGTECQSTAASSNKPFNTTTGNLQNVGGGTAWRTLYLGTRGWEIDAGSGSGDAVATATGSTLTLSSGSATASGNAAATASGTTLAMSSGSASATGDATETRIRNPVRDVIKDRAKDRISKRKAKVIQLREVATKQPLKKAA